MLQALKLSAELPVLYCKVLFAFEDAPLTYIAVIGALGLVSGVLVAAIKRQPDVLTILISPVASHIFIIAGGLVERGLQPTTINTIMLIFGAAQIALLGYLIYRLKTARLAATMLATFAATYAFGAMILATFALKSAT